ncbi:MAG: hypothetical protein OEX97_10300, partial [Acidimicrobiia bacterium]|nr:hypothetical protein [Acidimicrobiia bacterium]
MSNSRTQRLRVAISRITILALAVSQFLTLGITSPVARAQTPAEVNVCLDGSCDYTSINAAINGTSAGDIVYVYPGTYYEDFGISQDRSIIGMVNPADPDERDPSQIIV